MNVHYRGHLSTKAYFLPQWTAHTFTNYLCGSCGPQHALHIYAADKFHFRKKWPWDDGSLKLSKFIEMNATQNIFFFGDIVVNLV